MTNRDATTRQPGFDRLYGESMSTPSGRSLLIGALVLASLLAGCAGPSSSPPVAPQLGPVASASPSALPEPPAAAAGQSRIPAGCDELLGTAGEELDLASRQADEERYWGAWWVSRLQAGLEHCYFESPAGDRLVLSVSVYSDPNFLEELYDTEVKEVDGAQVSAGCPELEPGVPYYCFARVVAGPYFLETHMYEASPPVDDSLIARHDVVLAGVMEAAAGLGDPLVAATTVPSERAWPTDCGGLDLSSSPSAGQFSTLSEPPYPAFIAPEDLPSGLLNAEPDRVVLACDWSPRRGAEFSELRVEILRGGGWALADPAALPGGRAVTVAGVDQARILEHPRLDGTVAGAVGPDLVIAHLFESTDAPSAADREAAAIALLADLTAAVGATS